METNFAFLYWLIANICNMQPPFPANLSLLLSRSRGFLLNNYRETQIISFIETDGTEGIKKVLVCWIDFRREVGGLQWGTFFTHVEPYKKDKGIAKQCWWYPNTTLFHVSFFFLGGGGGVTFFLKLKLFSFKW